MTDDDDLCIKCGWVYVTVYRYMIMQAGFNRPKYESDVGVRKIESERSDGVWFWVYIRDELLRNFGRTTSEGTGTWE